MTFIVSALPRTGSEALIHALLNSGLNVCPNEPFYVDNNLIPGVDRHNHIEFTRKILEDYDGFKISLGHTMQLLDMCEQTNSKLILLRRNNFYAFIASYIGLLTGNMGKDSSSQETWTSSGKEMIYEPMPFIDHIIDRFLYYNHLIDSVYNSHESYLTTVHYEDPLSGITDLENYFNREINLQLTPNPPLSKYFLNHEEFKLDIEKRLKKLSPRGFTF